MVMLRSWPVYRRENGHVTEVVSLIEREWSCYAGGQFNGRRMVMLQKRSLHWRENGDREVVSWRANGHVTEVASLMEGKWFCYKGLFNGGGMVMLRGWSV